MATLVVLGSARPDIGLKLRQQQLLQQQQGYNYQPPSTNYGVPNLQQANQFQQTATNQFQQSQRIPSGSYIPSQPSGSYLTPQLNFNENTFAGGFQSSLLGNQGVTSLANQIGTGFDGSTSSQFGSTSSQGNLQHNQVQKHVYFYEAPFEPEAPHFRHPIPVKQATTNYKIIFIKAPTQAPPTAPIIPLQPQNEEKTLVYVLVKKPDEQPDIHIPEPIPTHPTKPEVYFIKYKTKQEAENKIQGTLQGSNNEGISANVVNSGAEFVSSIKDTLTHSASGSTSQTQALNGNFGDSSFSSQTGGTSSISNLSSSQSGGSIGLTAGHTGGHAQYGPPDQSGPYKK